MRVKLIDALFKLAFKQSQHNHLLFIRKNTEGMVIILMYVDDVLVIGDSLKLIKETKISLQKVFKIKDLGELKFFLGIEFARFDKENHYA